MPIGSWIFLISQRLIVEGLIVEGVVASYEWVLVNRVWVHHGQWVLIKEGRRHLPTYVICKRKILQLIGEFVVFPIGFRNISCVQVCFMFAILYISDVLQNPHV